MLNAISNEFSRLKMQHYGKGPSEVSAYQNGEFIFVVMKDGLTRVEETLVAAGRHELVRQVRLEFQHEMKQTFRSSIERITKRRVAAYESQMLFSPHYAVEIILLEPAEDDRLKD